MSHTPEHLPGMDSMPWVYQALARKLWRHRKVAQTGFLIVTCSRICAICKSANIYQWSAWERQFQILGYSAYRWSITLQTLHIIVAIWGFEECHCTKRGELRIVSVDKICTFSDIPQVAWKLQLEWDISNCTLDTKLFWSDDMSATPPQVGLNLVELSSLLVIATCLC